MSNVIVTYEIVRQAFTAYHDIPSLSNTLLADTGLIQHCLIENDEIYPLSKGYTVKALLDWSLAQLLAKNKKTTRISYETLVKRYIEKLSVSQYANEYDLFEQTIEARRKSATKRIAAILEHELHTLANLSAYQYASYYLRYQECSPDEQQALKFLALWKDPIPLANSSEYPISLHLVATALQQKNLAWLDKTNHNIEIHPQFKFFVSTLSSEEEKKQTLLKISQICKNWQNYLKAVDYLQEANELKQAAQFILTLDHTILAESVEYSLQLLAAFTTVTVGELTWYKLKLITGDIKILGELPQQARKEYEQVLGSHELYLQAKAYYGIARVDERLKDIEVSLLSCMRSQDLLASLQTEEAYQLLVRVYVLEAELYTLGKIDKIKAKNILNAAEVVVNQYNSQEWSTLKSDVAANWGLYYYIHDEPEQMLHYLWQAWSHAHESKNNSQIINAAYNLGAAYYFGQKDYAKALRYYRECIELGNLSNNKRALAMSNKGIGNCYCDQGQYEKSIFYLLKAYIYFRNSGSQNLLGSVSHDLAESYIPCKHIQQGRKYYQQSYSIALSNQRENLQKDLEVLCHKFPILTVELNKRQEAGLDIMYQAGKLTNNEYQSVVGVSASTALKDFSDLVAKGCCVRVGKGRGSHYKPIERMIGIKKT